MSRLLAILGPTATGKTDLALTLAKRFNGELVACDSRQVYKHLDIGTAKMPGMSFLRKQESRRLGSRVKPGMTKYEGRWKIDGINIWMYDVANPQVQYSVHDYVAQSTKVIEDIISRGKLPILVGGTGLYAKALLDGLPNLAIPVDVKLRAKLEKLDLNQLQARLKQLDQQRWQSLNNSEQNNPRRLLRSIELILMNPYINNSDKREAISDTYDILRLGLTAPRPVLNQRIDSRLDSHLAEGLVEEGKILSTRGVTLERMKKLGLEYGVLALYLEGVIKEDQLVDQLRIKLHQYAKRQLTWFNKEKNIAWFDVSLPKWQIELESRVRSWYHAEGNK